MIGVSISAPEAPTVSATKPDKETAAISGKPVFDLFCETIHKDVEPASYHWMLDSGSSHHMTYSKSYFSSFHICRMPVKTANNGVFYTEGYGDVILQLINLRTNGNLGVLRLQNVWYAPLLIHNLLSIRQLARTSITSLFKADETAHLL
jgi:hypothetical protein